MTKDTPAEVMSDREPSPGGEDPEAPATATHTTTTTTTTAVDKDDFESRKKKIMTEIEMSSNEVYERPQKPLDEVFKKQQEEEKDTFDNLIKDNVTLEREKRKLSEQLQESKAHGEVLKVEVDTQKEQCAELEAKVKSLEVEIKNLKIANRKQGLQRKISMQSSEPFKDPDTEDNNNEEEELENKSDKKRIRELQFRLLRMTTDMEEKDKDKEMKEKEMEEMKSYVEELEALVEPLKLQEAKKRREERKQELEEGKKQDRANVVKQSGGATNSKICVIM